MEKSILKEPIVINKVVLENRIVMPPMATGKADANGTVTEELVEYYKARAAGGYVGLIETEHVYIDPAGIASLTQVSMAKDEDIVGMKRIVDAVHGAGTAKIFVQINHAGISKEPRVSGKAVGPSAVNKPWKTGLELPHALTGEEIADIVDKFAKAALRAKKAGADGVEIHAAHGNLLNQFYSPITNKREDAYGGSLENRIRMIQEVLLKSRKAVGEDFAISVRLGGVDYYEGGNTLEDCVETCRYLEAWGADMLSLTGGMKGFTRPGHTEAGYFKEMSVAAKKAVHIPVMLTGGVTIEEEAEALLKENAADLIGVGRVMMKDARWAEKFFVSDGGRKEDEVSDDYACFVSYKSV